MKEPTFKLIQDPERTPHEEEVNRLVREIKAWCATIDERYDSAEHKSETTRLEEFND